MNKKGTGENCDTFSGSLKSTINIKKILGILNLVIID